MRAWIQIVENNAEIVDADYVIHYIAELNDRDDPYEGDVPERIASFHSFIREPFPVKDLQLEGYQYDPSLAREYANYEISTMPPIVVEPDGEIIDGYHRAQAAVINGVVAIDAWVGFNPL